MNGFYARLRESRKDDQSLQDCIETVVNRLESINTSIDQPGMLLGKIQSGKTRGFLGIIARAFDRHFDIALVFTKGTKTLAKQTVSRISNDFKEFIDNEELDVYDIMDMPEKMMRSELKRKIVIVAKKESKNIARVIDLFTTKHPELSKRRVLLVDDEADMASVRFVRAKGKESYTQGSIAQQIDDLRQLVNGLAFLQVTATPYSLYLQPEEYEPQENQFIFHPKKPAFTELLPIHGGYVGGDEYFGNFEENDFRYYLFKEVPVEEQNVLRSADGRAIRDDRIWTSKNITILRLALMSFLVAVVIRRWQQEQQEQRLGKYVMVIHNDTQRQAHSWQAQTVEKILLAFKESAEANDSLLKNIHSQAYTDLKSSVTAHGGRIESEQEIFNKVKELILDEEIHVQQVNSDTKLAPLLDPQTAELKRRTQANIFIGGSILDRGITIPSLIAFYYGRNPKKMQADTVLQHSRMYGNRDKADLAVTRLYTSREVYTRLEKIHALETALRKAFENGDNKDGVVFIQNDSSGGISPCSPTKIALSNVTTIDTAGFYLPSGFDTKSTIKSKETTEKLTKALAHYPANTGEFSEITLSQALEYIEETKVMLNLDNTVDFDWSAMTGLLQYYCKANQSDKVMLLVGNDRDLDRNKSGDKSGRSIVGTVFRATLLNNRRKQPALIMLQQKGSRQRNWSADEPFWWPILAAPTVVEPCIFANSRSK